MHRSVAVIAVSFLLLPWAVQAQAQDPLLTDGDGDALMSVMGQETSPPTDRYDFVDLEALDWVETPEGFDVTLTVAGLSYEPSDLSQRGQYTIGFQYGGYAWELHIYRDVSIDGAIYYGAGLAYLEDEDDRGNFVANYDVRADDAAGTLSVQVGREDLFDTSGKSPGIGDVLQDFWVESRGGSSGSICIATCQGTDVRDRMPDDGVAGVLELVMGVSQDGDAVLSSESPFRVSNGGATTIVYEVRAENLGDRQSFALAVEGDVPEGWDISLPFESVVIDEGDDESIPILLTTPSGHQHGGSEKFLLTLTGEKDRSDVGRIELGVRYTDIPQPAGHHSRLFLHAYDPYGYPLLATEGVVDGLGPSHMAYFNALDEDPGDLDEPVHPWSSGGVPGTQDRYSWWMGLEPNLQIGLDFDPSKDGSITIPIQYDYMAQEVVLRGTLWYYSESKEIQIGDIVETQPASWGPGLQEFVAVIDISDEADFIEYEPHAYLGMEIELEGMFIGVGPFGPGATPAIVPTNAFMDLPLNEYRDPIDKFYRAVESLVFDDEYLELPVNPAETVVFETRLRNSGTTDETVHLNVTGVNDEWVTIIGDDAFDLARGESRDIAVAVKVPEGTPDGALADLVLQAVSQEDANRRALLDVVAIVDTEEDHPNDAAIVEELQERLHSDKQSPGFEVAAVMAGLLAIVLVMRRRDQGGPGAP